MSFELVGIDVGNGGRIYSLMSNDVEYSLMYGVSTDVTDLVTVVDNEGLTDVGTLIEGEPLADTDKDIILELETLEDIVIDNVIEVDLECRILSYLSPRSAAAIFIDFGYMSNRCGAFVKHCLLLLGSFFLLILASAFGN